MCLIPLLLGICLADPAELTLSGDLSQQISGDFTYRSGGHSYGGGSVGRVQLEMPVVISERFQFFYGVEHMSLVDTRSDRGQERAYLGFAWKPFK